MTTRKTSNDSIASSYVDSDCSGAVGDLIIWVSARTIIFSTELLMNMSGFHHGTGSSVGLELVLG